MASEILIKRYANRKLYDTEHSRYVTLDDIADMVREHNEIRVIDNKSGDDLTAITFAQVILEEEKRSARTPLTLLKGIIRDSNHVLNDFYQHRIHDPVMQITEDVERRVEQLWKKPQKKDSKKQDELKVENDNNSSEAQDLSNPTCIDDTKHDAAARDADSETQQSSESLSAAVIEDRIHDLAKRIADLERGPKS